MKTKSYEERAIALLEKLERPKENHCIKRDLAKEFRAEKLK